MTFWAMFWFGFLKVLPLIIVSYVVGLGVEFIAAQIRGHEVNEGYLVTGMLIPLIMPVDVPLWILSLSVIFAVIVGKEVFGGTGMNIWNPALLSRAFVFFAYPSQISGDKIWIEGLTKGEGIVAASPVQPRLHTQLPANLTKCHHLWICSSALSPAQLERPPHWPSLLEQLCYSGQG